MRRRLGPKNTALLWAQSEVAYSLNLFLFGVDGKDDPGKLDAGARELAAFLLMRSTNQAWFAALAQHGCSGREPDGSFPCKSCNEISKLGTERLWAVLTPRT
jgi:hypothetical protein